MQKQITLDAGTPLAVANILADYHHSGKRLRLFYGDSKTGRDWGEENDTTGYIGLSMGPTQIYLLIPTRRDIGGGAILTACIVKIVDTSSRRVLYQHPKYNAGKYILRAEEMGKGYGWRVDRDGENVANFKRQDKAQKYIDFMLGNQMST